MSRNTRKTADVIAFPAAAAAPAPVQQTGPSLDIDVDPTLFTVDDLRAVLDRFPGQLLVRIAFLTESQRKPDVYPLTRIVAGILDEPVEDDNNPRATIKIPALSFVFDESVEPADFEGPHNGDEPPPPLVETGRRGKREA